MATADRARNAAHRRQPTTKRIGTCKLMFERGVCNGAIVQVTTPRYEVPNKDFIGDQEEHYAGDTIGIPFCQKCGVQRLNLTPAEKK